MWKCWIVVNWRIFEFFFCEHFFSSSFSYALYVKITIYRLVQDLGEWDWIIEFKKKNTKKCRSSTFYLFIYFLPIHSNANCVNDILNTYMHNLV